MNLFTALSDYKMLRKKYNNFEAPTLKLVVDGTELSLHGEIGIANLTVELSCLYPASGASFDVINQYEAEKTNFAQKTERLFQVGARVEIKLGYLDTERVFYGLIAEVAYHFGGDSTPYIHVDCCDAKFILMKNRRLEVYSDTRLSQLVSDICSAPAVSSYTTGKQIEITEQAELKSHVESDYDFIVRQAQLIGYEFFVFDGKFYFRKPPMLSAPMLMLNSRDGIESAVVSLRGSSLTGKISVMGIDPQNDSEIKSSAGLSGKYSKTSSARQMLRDTEVTHFCVDVKSNAEAEKYAKLLARKAAEDFGLIQCKTVGLPQIVPGRYIGISGLMGIANRNFYVTAVQHRLDEDEFSTSFEGRFDSL